MHRAAPLPWYQDIKRRVRFEAGIRREFPGHGAEATGRGRGAVVVYRMTVDVPYYEPHQVVIRLINSTTGPVFLTAHADGPEDSPHRYPDASLCMWHPKDTVERRWIGADGLLTLVRALQLHLFREARWRKTGRWAGEEVPHATGTKEPG